MNIFFRVPNRQAAKARLAEELITNLKAAPVHRFDVELIQKCAEAYIDKLPIVAGRDLMVAVSASKLGKINNQQSDVVEEYNFGLTVRLMPPNE